MEKHEYVSNYSVYIQMGGQLKNPYYASKRVKMYGLEEAQKAMENCWNGYKGRLDVVLMRFDAPYRATIIQFKTKKEEFQEYV